jgi:glutamine synthetase type III
MRSIHDYYAELVFTEKVMEQKLSKNIYKKLTAAIENLEPLDPVNSRRSRTCNERMGA